MRVIWFVISIFVFPSLLFAQNPVIIDPVFSKIDFGAFCQQRSVGERPAPDTQAAKIDLLAMTPDIRWPGTIVPARPGVSFGVRTETVDGAALSPVLIEVTHPPFVGSGVTQQSYFTALGGDGASINAYSFDLLEELVIGPWTLRASHNGRVLYQVTFDVVPSESAPDIGPDCGKEFTS